MSGKSNDLSGNTVGLTGRTQRPDTDQVRGTAEVAVMGRGQGRGLQAAVGGGRVPELWGAAEQVTFGCAPTWKWPHPQLCSLASVQAK